MEKKPPESALSDSFVADLVVADAADYALRYSAHGLAALNAPKAFSAQPKPNTRFLRNIIRATDSHNAALLAREASESRARLRNMQQPETERKRRGQKEVSRRQVGEINAILGAPSAGRKRKADDAQSEHADKKRRGEARDRSREKERQRSRDGERRSSKEGTHERERGRERARGRDKDAATRDTRERSRERRQRSSSRSKSRSRERHGRRHRRHHSSYGPQPVSASTPRPRGRGVASAASGIDQRFAEGYDPQTDVSGSPHGAGNAGEDMWMQMTGLFRLRQKVKAGVEGQGQDKEEGDPWAGVKWRGKGEKREWDEDKEKEEE
ncbi:hypothetical protein TD95_003193 [Thielaviopsis punctulata]|uniref:Pre-mRNA-splicing factor 38B n=1 Tax=Thielaviopsis punctulata TaxID=72032 RepID=A0A0F4ZD15_9PEZI|nr:hypothetical protein TD95_003193 [Thielaviopsis punctulata]